MKTNIAGLHHVTAVAIDPQANIEFCTKVLGLRLIKETVNFDDPGTYHFYYGDDAGGRARSLRSFPSSWAPAGREEPVWSTPRHSPCRKIRSNAG
jgi:glyoxalase family protein